MADEFQLGSGNWWDTSRNRSFESGTIQSPSISTTLNAIAGYGWSTEMVDMKSNDSETASAAAHDQSSGGGGGCGGGVLANPNLQMVGLGLSSQNMEWNQALFRGEKGGSSFRSLLQEGLSSTSGGFQQESGTAAQEHWRQKVYSAPSSEDSPVNDYKQINHRGFSLEQPQFSSQASSNDSTITSQNLTTPGFQVDSSAAAYGLLFPENQQQQHHSAYQNRPMNYNPYQSSGVGYGGNAAEMATSWNKYPPFLRTSAPQAAAASNTNLHFVNSTPFWNPPTALPTQNLPEAPSFDEKPKKESEVAITTKKNTTETSNKRPRNETPSPLPAFKVRKEKMGDRITALQQLVSPFGKTDTASVLSEAIEYIKFLHEQVSALSTPYMKNGAPTQHQQNCDKSKDPDQGPREDLRSRGLCLVPVTSTFPVTHETAVDFWTPTFGVTFR